MVMLARRSCLLGSEGWGGASYLSYDSESNVSRGRINCFGSIGE